MHDKTPCISRFIHIDKLFIDSYNYIIYEFNGGIR